MFLCDYDIHKMDLKEVPPFYVDILKVWQDIENCRHFENEKSNPIVFNNRHVCLRNRMIFDKDLLQRGIHKQGV